MLVDQVCRISLREKKELHGRIGCVSQQDQERLNMFENHKFACCLSGKIILFSRSSYDGKGYSP